MSHWAELDENNIVLRVLVCDNNDPAGDEGYSWLINNLGGRWVQTSYNGNFRGHFASIGDKYDEVNDTFYIKPPIEPSISPEILQEIELLKQSMSTSEPEVTEEASTPEGE